MIQHFMATGNMCFKTIPKKTPKKKDLANCAKLLQHHNCFFGSKVKLTGAKKMKSPVWIAQQFRPPGKDSRCHFKAHAKLMAKPHRAKPGWRPSVPAHHQGL